MKKQIEFHLVHDFPNHAFTTPAPSKKTTPDWLKQIPPMNAGTQTVKKCIPFIDAMTSGYMLLNHIDISITLGTDGKVLLHYLDDEHKALISRWPPIETHPSTQVPGSPMEDFTILKYMSPWKIKTPKEYSLLFLPPINRFELPIIPLVGLVDTDSFDNVVNIPFIHTQLHAGGPPVFIARGTPICQIIPIRRDTWSSKTTLLDAYELDKTVESRAAMNTDRTDWYRKKIHNKKEYN